MSSLHQVKHTKLAIEPCYITTLPQGVDALQMDMHAVPEVPPRNNRKFVPEIPPKINLQVTPALPRRNAPNVTLRSSVNVTPINEKVNLKFDVNVPSENSVNLRPRQSSTHDSLDTPKRNSVHFNEDIIPPKSSLKGILKNTNSPKLNNIERSHIYETCGKKTHSNKIEEQNRLLSSESVGHFDLKFHEKGFVASKESHVQNSQKEQTTSKKIKQKKKVQQKTAISIASSNSALKKTTSEEKPTKGKLLSLGKPVKYTYNSYEKASTAAKMESISGVLHLFVIIFCIIIISLMTKVNHDWQLQRRRCPLYVKGTASINVYWGNEKFAACNYSAFMPVLIIVISLTLILFHGGVLCSWRHGGDTSKILLSKTYPKIMFYVELFELIILISVAAVLTDGFRQTCVGFQTNPWPEYRPMHCKEGFQNRDDAYDISHTYSRILTSVIISWVASCFLLTSVVCFLTRSNFGKKK